MSTNPYYINNNLYVLKKLFSFIFIKTAMFEKSKTQTLINQMVINQNKAIEEICGKST